MRYRTLLSILLQLLLVIINLSIVLHVLLKQTRVCQVERSRTETFSILVCDYVKYADVLRPNFPVLLQELGTSRFQIEGAQLLQGCP